MREPIGCPYCKTAIEITEVNPTDCDLCGNEVLAIPNTFNPDEIMQKLADVARDHGIVPKGTQDIPMQTDKSSVFYGADKVMVFLTPMSETKRAKDSGNSAHVYVPKAWSHGMVKTFKDIEHQGNP